MSQRLKPQIPVLTKTWFFLYFIICQPWPCLLPPKTCSNIPRCVPSQDHCIFTSTWKFFPWISSGSFLHLKFLIIETSPFCKIIMPPPCHSLSSLLCFIFSHITSSYIICLLVMSFLCLSVECKLHQRRTFIFTPLSPEHCLAWHSNISWSNEWMNARHILTYLVLQK